MKNYTGDLKMRALQSFSELEAGASEGSCCAVGDLVDKIRNSLTLPNQQLGVWETMELNYAGRALEAGFPRLALISAGKAIAVNRLSLNEYAFGFSAVREHTKDAAEKIKISTNALRAKKESATDLLTSQQEAATTLEHVEEEAAQKLALIEKTTAETLNLSQKESATALAKEDRTAAGELVQAQADGLALLKTVEEKRAVHMHDHEQTLSWMSGGYSIEASGSDLSPDNTFNAMNDMHKAAAQELKYRQERTADTLKDSQFVTASSLKKSQTIDAAGLKTGQHETAIRLKDRQTLKALHRDDVQ